jgi:hypothetical protein
MPKLVTRGGLARVALVFFAVVSALAVYAYTAAGSGATAVAGVPAQASRDEPHAGQAEAFRLRPRTSEIADVVHIYLGVESTAGTVTVGIYSNAGGRPGALLSAGSGSSVDGHGWNVVRVGRTRLKSRRTYWLAVLSGRGMHRYRSSRHKPCLSNLSVQTHLRKLPKRWRTGRVRALAHCPIVAYVADTDFAPSGRQPASSPTGSSPAPSAPQPSPAAIVPAPEEPSPLPQAPADTVPPAISGPTIVGETLSSSPGTWTGSPTAYAYQWENCDALGEGCLSIGGATESSYTLAPSDLASTIRVVVTASNANGSTAAISPATGTVLPLAPANEAPPVLTGVAEAGETLTASPGTWAGSPTAYAYTWEDCDSAGEACSEVSGATSPSYKLTASDVTHTIVVVVTATNAGGSTPAASSPSAVVVPELTAPANETPPSISGSALVGEQLSASHGTWTGHPTAYAYQWENCNAAGGSCSEIAGATSPKYTLTTGDIGHTIRVVVTASNPSGPASASSDATATVVAKPPAAPANTALPAISGSDVEGDTLKASNGTWTGSPTSYAYQWEDCNAAGGSCSEISGATSSSRKLASSDVGHTLRVVVKATNAGGTGKATSAATSTVVPPAPANTAAPAVSGSDVEGDTLKASTGTWTGSPTSYAYQWEDCNTAGAACSDLGGATAQSYTLASSDVGHTLRVIVTASNSGGHNSATSAATSEVTAKETSKTGTTGCFEDPESEGTSRFEACGYPGPKNAGVVETGGKTECSSLPEYTGSRTIGTEGTTIEGKELEIDIAGKSGGGISVDANKVTFKKDCFLIKGECGCLQEGPAIALGGGYALTVEDSTFRSPSTTESVEKDIWFNSSGSDIVAKDDRFEDCGECLNGLGTVEITGSYMNASQWEGHEPENNELHRENIYMMQGTATVEDSTMFVPDDEVAEIFDEDNGIACDTHVRFENNLLAGSGGMFQLCGHSNGQTGTGSTIIDHNRVARCLTTPIKENGDGIPYCSGPYVEGADSHGFMPYGGSSQILGNGEANPYGATKEFEGNYWDDNLKTITVKEAEG